MWSAEPIGAVSSARAPNATGHSLDSSRGQPLVSASSTVPTWPLAAPRALDERPRHKPRATAKAPSRYAVHRTAVTAADDKARGRFPGAQPRGPRPGFAAEGPAAATSRSRANARVNAAARSHPTSLSEPRAPFPASASDKSAGPEASSDLSEREALIAASGSDKPAGSASGERQPDVAILPGAVDLASPVRPGDPVLQIAGDLEHPQAGAQNVYGEPDLDAPTAGQRRRSLK